MPVYKQLRKHKILLDTHIWIWLMDDDPRVKKGFKQYVNEVTERGEEILISIISVWELGMLVERKRIELEIDTQDWVEESLKKGFKILPITPSIAINSSKLPETPHGDPADRLLIATANENHAILVTHDRKILDYGKGKYIGVYDPC